MHEVAVVATYMREHGLPAALRFLWHELLRTLDFEREDAARFGHDPKEDPDYHEKESLRQRILDEFGPQFHVRYGWAADIVGKVRPTFEDIEAKAGMASWRRAYEVASLTTHMNTSPLSPSDLLGESRELTGPSDRGTASPGVTAVRTLMQLDSTMLGVFVPTAEDLATDISTAIALDMLAREAMDEFAAHEWPDWNLPHRSRQTYGADHRRPPEQDAAPPG